MVTIFPATEIAGAFHMQVVEFGAGSGLLRSSMACYVIDMALQTHNINATLRLMYPL